MDLRSAVAPPPPTPTSRPQPLARCDDRWATLVGVLTDIDDTLTREGTLDAPAAAALAALHAARVPVVAVTGRSLRWCREVAATWPQAVAFAALVAENGATALRPAGTGWQTLYAQPHAVRRAHTRRLRACAAAVCREVPGAVLSRDSVGRETDIAIDHSEHAHLDEAGIARVLAVMRAHGLHATVSSIHVNGWIGTHDKLSGARWMVRCLWGRDLDAEIDRWVYVGDSTNDQVMFAAFPMSVGVANLRRFADRLQTWPAYIAEGERGAGFAEVARRLLAARGAA